MPKSMARRNDRLRLDRQGTLPLIERHFTYDKARLVVIDPDDSDREILDARGVRFIHQRENYRDLLVPMLTAGGGRGFCVNLSVDTSSIAIMELAREIRAFYIDTYQGVTAPN
jgi:homospermidine synthase